MVYTRVGKSLVISGLLRGFPEISTCSVGFSKLPVDDVLTAMGHLMVGPSAARAMFPMVITMIAAWFVYVPIHELLHCYGCIWTGGTVSRLEIKWYYFGGLLQDYFPFVTLGSDYAGQLTGFDTFGNDWIYLSCVFAPFILSVLFGVALIRWCTKKRRTWLFGPSIVLGCAPFYNIQGDYYEMASICLTRALTWLSGGGNPPRFEGLRSDDIFTLFPLIVTEPSVVGIEASFSTMIFALLLAIIGVMLSILMAFATYWVGGLVANVLVGPAPVFEAPKPRRRRRKKRPAPTE